MMISDDEDSEGQTSPVKVIYSDEDSGRQTSPVKVIYSDEDSGRQTFPDWHEYTRLRFGETDFSRQGDIFG